MSKQPCFDNPVIFFYSYGNQPGHPKNNLHRIDVINRLLLFSRFKYILLLNASLVADLERSWSKEGDSHAGQEQTGFDPAGNCRTCRK